MLDKANTDFNAFRLPSGRIRHELKLRAAASLDAFFETHITYKVIIRICLSARSWRYNVPGAAALSAT